MSAVQTLTVAEDEADIRLDRWFKRHLPQLAHGMLEKLLRAGQIRVDGKRAKSNQRLVPGQAIRVPPLPETPAPAVEKASRPVSDDEARMLQQAVLHMDDHVIVLNKPPGLAVQGGTGMERHLDAMLDALRFGAERPRLVHRLDKDTSGVLMLGRTAAAAAKLAAAFRSRSARKLYWAVVVGVPKLSQGRIDAPLAKLTGRMGDKVAVDEDEGKRAVTWYRTIEAVKRAAWLELDPRTGRTHQLRAHCALLGTPIQGDGKYGGAEAFLSGQGVSKKLHLHARAIRMPHPKGGGMIEVVAPLPPHFETTFGFFGFDERQAGVPFAAFDVD